MSGSVLVVDDERALLRVLSMQFAEEGYVVYTAPDGATAVELMRAHHPDVVVLDAVMPGMTGLDVCRQTRADPELASVTILVLTAHDALEEPSFAAGADGFVSKPYALQSLSARVRELMAQHPARVEPPT